MLVTFSCGRSFGEDPKVATDDRKLEFGVLGGEKVVNILNRHGDPYDGKRFDIITTEQFVVDTLNDGRIKCRYDDWVDFIVTPDYKKIRVVVSENKTGSERHSMFLVHGQKLGFSLFVWQGAK